MKDIYSTPNKKDNKSSYDNNIKENGYTNLMKKELMYYIKKA